MLLYIILGIIAGFLVVVWRKPGDFKVERSIIISAPASAIHPHINNLKAMNVWNPWATYDPKSIISYEGPEAGPGAIYTWGGGKMGAGRFQIKSSEATKITSELTMIKPMAADNIVVHSLEQTADGTKVTWAMSGCNSFAAKLMHTVMNMEKMMNKEFDKGLAGLKAIVEQKKLS